MRDVAGQRDPANGTTQNAADFHAWLESAEPHETSPQSTPAAEPTMDHELAVALTTTSTFEATAGVVYPRALQAQAYLSQVGTERRGEPPRPDVANAAVSLLARDPHVRPLVPLTATGITTPANLAGDSLLAPALIPRALGLSDVTNGSESTLAHASGKAIVASWPERLLRRTSDAHGNTTWWLRDYRMGDAEREALTHTLVSYSPEQRPDRIVINGVEVWRAPHLLPES